jgi:acetolactate synthase-1/2/3 large subunit
LCGHGLNPLYVACQARGIRLIDTRNEQAAAYLAEACGRLSRRVGVCAVSSGVAHVNGLTGVANAHLDGAPMLLLSGSGAVATMGLGHFQDLDQVAMAVWLVKITSALKELTCQPDTRNIHYHVQALVFGLLLDDLPWVS